MSGYRTGNPSAEAARLKGRFRSVTRRIEYRSRLRTAIRFSLICSSIIVGMIGAYLAAYVALTSFRPWPPLTTVRHLAVIPNCDTARLLGLAPSRRGQPGYWSHLDADDDGIACEPVPPWKVRYFH